MVSAVEQKIFDCIKNKRSFVLDAGAGSGKTWALVQALNYIIDTKSKEINDNGQKIVDFQNMMLEEIWDLLVMSVLHI
jgi:DNA helicase-2/ATP-dependent DNA helicase PcrA